MKRVFLLALFLSMLAGAHAAASEGQKIALQARRTAADLFASGQAAAAVAHLQLKLPIDPAADGSTTALVQGLIDVANVFYNQRKLNFARDAANQAFSAADSIILARSAAPALKQAGLLSSLGVLSEEVMRDLRRAESLYAAAAALEPGNPQHAARKKAVVEKQKPRGGL